MEVRRPTVLGGLACLLALWAAAAGCQDDSPTAGTGGGADASSPDTGGPDEGGGCVLSNGGIEICDYTDNDCNGVIDDGFDVSRDPDNCGACGNVCVLPDVEEAGCEGGLCTVVSCAEGHFDTDGLPETGCEAPCLVSNGGIETCDHVDNDCDGLVDEGFDFDTDAENCGGCGVVCSAPGAITGCDRGLCVLTGCLEDLHDLDGLYENGCEAGCVPDEGGVEVCDDRDNDCDGATDEDWDKRLDITNCGDCGVVCSYPNARAHCVLGECRMGDCDPGFFDRDRDPATGCEAPCIPSNGGDEICDGLDNDCDGQVDEGFDLLGDPANCGECGWFCAFANAIPACVEGQCVVGRCEPGFVDADALADNGCEARCEVEGDGVEVCDGRDNDCNGITDDGWDKESDVANCGACGRVCSFRNGVPACVAGVCRLVACQPGFSDINGLPQDGCEAACVVEGDGVEVCDGRDNDCNGITDDGFDLRHDPRNCGACGRVCAGGQAALSCEEGTCRIASCAEGWFDADRNPNNGCEYRCTPAAGVEECNGVDDDCDGRTDEGFDLRRSVAHCGACGNACAAPHAVNVCTEGRCETAGCQDGWHDRNGDPEDGCEYSCVPTAGGVEACDGLDNDCNGETDEGFDLARDPWNCGECNLACSFPNATARCEGGRCLPGACLPGWHDLDGDLLRPGPGNGCEYRCDPTGDGTEACDGRDNDCDGATDEDFDLASSLEHCGACGRACHFAHAAASCVDGACRMGGCDAGWADWNRDPADGCEAGCTPSNGGVEACDGLDNDCNGLVDDGFDLANDPEHCGRCDRRCALPGAVSFCDSGVCAVLSCVAGRRDVDGLAENGCECALTNGGVEACDGLDNDCDGRGDNDLPPPPIQCARLGVCEGIRATCHGAGGWSCDYPATFEAVETRCDGLDNDCDGQVDEGYPERGQLCTVGLGVCQEVGRYRCNAAGNGLECNVEAHPERATPEVCNGLDDDCDGEVDEDSDVMVEVGDFRVYAYEAARTDATALDPGESFDRACSRAGVLPWVEVSWSEAQLACHRAGAYLCPEEVWRAACGGPEGWLYPYHPRVYDPMACNGFDHPARGPLPTGTLDRCESPEGTFDQSGNVWEWVDADRSPEGDGSIRLFMGGGFDNIAPGLRCTFGVAASPRTARSNIGFRCCSDLACAGVDCPPGTYCREGECLPDE